jgi:rfaE bifunctional protein kinase chain/domain
MISASDLRKAKVLVVGDVMLDRYWFGDVSRISPEAPVPVVKVGRNEERLGGAANVARNIAALGANCALLSVVGTDEAGQALMRLLKAEKIDARLHEDGSVATTIKLRVIGRQQQLLRIDFEQAPGEQALARKFESLRELIGQAGVLVIRTHSIELTGWGIRHCSGCGRW